MTVYIPHPDQGVITGTVTDKDDKGLKVKGIDGKMYNVALGNDLVFFGPEGKGCSGGGGGLGGDGTNVVIDVHSFFAVAVVTPEDMEGVWAPGFMTTISIEFPVSEVVTLAVRTGGGVGFLRGHTTWGTERNDDRAFFIGSIGIGLQFELHEYVDVEVFGDFLYTANGGGVGGQGGANLVVNVHENVSIVAGVSAGWMPTGISPDSNDEWGTAPDANFTAVTPRIGLRFKIPVD